MPASALRGIDWSKLRLTRAECRNACVAGALWGGTLAAGLTAMSAWHCGGVCLPEVAVNLGLAVAAGVLGIGPVVGYGARR
jgi:hypothetical protein